ncbi:hypothetical protein ABZ780_22385 [Micromonospora sp. NPDC047467]|uniref:hypothetical protein n=1 Tax=Micromonospora sp. NPDC047467 TaxID=3154814 RepID=UPI0033F9E4CB
MDLVGQWDLGVVRLAVQVASVEVVQVRVVGRALSDDPGQFGTDGGERQPPGTALGRIARERSLQHRPIKWMLAGPGLSGDVRE